MLYPNKFYKNALYEYIYHFSRLYMGRNRRTSRHPHLSQSSGYGLLSPRSAHDALETPGKKAAPGVVKYDTNLQLLLKVAFYALLFGGLLYSGDSFIRSELRFRYTGNAQLLFAAVAALAAFSRLNALRKRSQIIWRMSHVPDYAERRKRTTLLKY